MESVIELLLETLAALNDLKFENFKLVLSEIHHQKHSSDIPWIWFMLKDLQDTVFLMVHTYGQKSVEMTVERLKELKETDLAQRLSDCSTETKKTLNDLNSEELKKFKRLLQIFFPLGNLSYISWRLSPSSTRADVVNLMMDKVGQQSVEVTREVFMCMNRTDLVQKLSESSSASREKHSVDEHGAALLKRKAAMDSVGEIVLEILSCLTQRDLQKFRLLLQLTCFKKELPQMEREYTETKHKLVDQMVDKLGHQSVEVTMEVLTDMNRTDLVQKLAELSKGCKEQEPKRRLKLEQDSSDWTKLEPEVNSTDADEAPTYSLQSAAGHFECRVSGLRWVCKGKTSFQYQFRSWEGHMERMESRQYMPAGPLMDVTVTAGKLNEVHLPHWICIDDIPDILDMFAVVHIDDCGDVVEKVSEVTPTHVKLTEPNFSIIGDIIRSIFPPKISCYMLMYYQPNTSFLKLHVYLIRQDPALEQKFDERKSCQGFQKIIKHHPDKYLQTEHPFSLRTDNASAKIQPKELTLRYNKQNFYEVYVKNPGSELILTLVHTHPVNGEPADEPLWKCEIRADESQRSGEVQEENTVDKHLAAQMQKAFTVQSDRERLLGMLEHLEKEELEKFKWLLVELKPIPKSKLEEANICNLTDINMMLRSGLCGSDRLLQDSLCL
ncbi:unnamed protein product [Oreochromis niloticus]|nr:unnamed protein product [Mustela putorius furo]